MPLESPTKPLTLLLIGAGRQMQNDHLPALMSIAGVRAAAVIDPNPVALQATASRVMAAGYTQLQSALDAVDPDAALVCLPHSEYRDVLEVLATRGIPTLKEKPLARSLPEGLGFIRRYEEAGTYLQLCVQRRFSDLYRTCQALIEQIGNVYSVYAEYTLNLRSLDKAALGWRADREISGGGATLDLGYHTVDLLTYLFGEPDRVYAQQNFSSIPGDYDIDDSVKALFTYRDGAINANLFATLIYRRKGERVRIFGDQGYVSIDDRTVSLFDFRDRELESHSFRMKEHDIRNQLAFFLDHVRAGGSSEASAKLLSDQLMNMKIIDAIYESHRSGREVTLSRAD